MKLLGVLACSLICCTPAVARTSCNPKSAASRILGFPAPNDTHPAWGNGAFVSPKWTFIMKDNVHKFTGDYMRGDLYSPRGTLANRDVYVLTNEWRCQSTTRR